MARDIMIALSRVHHPVTVLGPGRRAGIWTQGCSIGCAGCVSRDTWDVTDGSRLPVGDVLAWLGDLPPEAVDGVTVSGGEPTDQPAALAALLEGIDAWRAARAPELHRPDVLVFTGRGPTWVRGAGARCLVGADVVVAGPYLAHRAGRSALRGSENQQLMALTTLGRERLAQHASRPRDAMQVEVTDDGIWMIGIPLPGAMEAVEARAAAHGVTWSGASWRG